VPEAIITDNFAHAVMNKTAANNKICEKKEEGDSRLCKSGCHPCFKLPNSEAG
jgi:hypothetical protein